MGGLIGGVVVAVIVIIALVVAIFFFLRRRREKGSNDVEQVEMKQKKRQKSIRHNMVTPPIRGQYFYLWENGHFGPRAYPKGSLVIALVRLSDGPWSVGPWSVRL